MDEYSQELGMLYKKYFDPDNPNNFDIETALSKTNLQDWEKESIMEAHFVEEQPDSRVVPIPHKSSRDSYNKMQDFIETVENGRFQDRLWKAIQGRGAFSRFKRTIQQNPTEEQRWYTYKDAELDWQVLEWLADLEIEPITKPV